MYDGSLSEPKFANTLAKIETHLTDLELQGRVGRLGPLKSAREMAQTALKAGATTIVAVGNDRTVAEIISAMAGSSATLGIIPIGKENAIADLLGIPEGEAACDVLAARKVETLDLGKSQHYYFLTSALVNAEDVTIDCDEQYSIEITGAGNEIRIHNLEPKSHCQDGFLEISIESKTEGGWFRRETKKSQLPFRQATFSTTKDEGSLLLEGLYALKLPATVEVVPEALKIIVGKDRVF